MESDIPRKIHTHINKKKKPYEISGSTSINRNIITISLFVIHVIIDR